MHNRRHLILISLIVIGVVREQLGELAENNVYKMNCQLNFKETLRISDRSVGGFRPIRNNRNLKSKLVVPTNMTGYIRLRNSKEYHAPPKIYKAVDRFNLTVWNLDSKKSVKVLEVLQEILSFTNLKTMESWLKVDTVVLYDFSDSILKSFKSFNIIIPPLLIIKDAINWKLKDVFTSNILSVVLLGAKYPSRHQLLNILKYSLKGAHLNKLIFIIETSITERYTDALQLINWLHANGFWQSFLMDYEENTLTSQHLTKTIMWNITIEKFLKQTSKWHNLQGFPITCSMASNPPRAYIHYDDSLHKVTLKGYYGAIINLFAQHLNASLKPFIITDLESNTELDCVKYINDNKLDICGDALPFHEQYVISDPEEISASYLMVPYATPLPRFYYFLKPFQFNVWSIVTCSFFYKVITLSLVHRLQHGYWNGSLHMLYAVLSVLYLPFQLNHIKGHYRRFLEILMILVGFVITNWYLSVLSSLLFSRLYFHDIKTLQHLADHNISIMVDEFEHYLLNNTKNDPIIMQQLKVVSQEVLLKHRGNLDPHYAYYSQYDKVDFYLHQQKFLLRPRMKVLTGIPPINKVLGGIPMSPDWPFQHLLNDFIKRIVDCGIYLHIYAKAMEEGILYGYLYYFPTEHHHVEHLSIEYFQMPAMLLAAGYSLAMAGFLLELLWFKSNYQPPSLV